MGVLKYLLPFSTALSLLKKIYENFSCGHLITITSLRDNFRYARYSRVSHAQAIRSHVKGITYSHEKFSKQNKILHVPLGPCI